MAKFKGLVKRCECCGAEFKVPQSQKHVRTCSTACGYKIRTVANKVDWVVCTCRQCGKEFTAPPSQAVARVYCSYECKHQSDEFRNGVSQRVSGAGNPGWKGGVSRAVTSITGAAYFRSASIVEVAKTQRRDAQKRLATPAWADTKAIRDVYKAAKTLTWLTGVKHHVDHIIPLQNGLVCGLHCESNLQIIQATDNLLKSNKLT